jgi:alkane 1-monooxygenase
MKRSLPFALAFIAPVLSGLGIAFGSWWLALPPLFLFVITPVMDALLGQDTAPFDDAAADRWRDLKYDAWLWLWIPVQLAVQTAALVVAARTNDPATLVGIVFASGLLGGLGINVAHEFMHRKGKPERALAELLMTSVGYTHFVVEHVLGHHKHVATPEDPATARKGESLAPFLVRSILGGVVSYWRLEGARAAKLSIPLGLRDRRVRYPLVFTALLALIAWALGPVALAVFVGQCLVAILLLETINYVEHYGLVRTRLASGAYQRVEPAHSWNSSHRLTSFYLFLLPRHADHHAHASRPYFALRHLDDSPQLPAGYSTMLLVALVPPLWRRIMDPRVDGWRAHASTSVAAIGVAHESSPAE